MVPARVGSAGPEAPHCWGKKAENRFNPEHAWVITGRPERARGLRAVKNP